ncbi:MAG: hypothetical protein IKO47_03365 [Ruminococcus sp.]|nr:hypothetical protein [Ruminococcus sp.]
MLGDILAEIIGEIIGEIIYNIIIKPIGLLLFYIFKSLFIFACWSGRHISAAAVFVFAPAIRLFKKADRIEDGKSPYYGNGYYESYYVNSSSDLND